MEDKIKDIINNDTGFIKKNDFKIKELNKEKCILEYEIKEDGLNPMGIVHGGVLFGLADTSAGILASNLGHNPLTLNVSMDFIRPAKSKKILAIASVLKKGKTIGFFEVKIIDENELLIASAHINMFNQ